MADIDPITREALRRASQLQGHSSRNSSPQSHEQRSQPSSPHEQRAHEQRREEEPHESPMPPQPTSNFGLEALFKDKETSVILILIVLLMGEKGSEHLLLALIYLLI